MTSPEEIETSMGGTRLPEVIAIQDQEEHGGNLNEALSAHFSEGDRNIVSSTSIAPQDDSIYINEPVQVDCTEPPFSLSAAGVEREERLASIEDWEKNEKAKVEDEIAEELRGIEAWENTETAPLREELRKMEEKLEQKKKRIAEIHEEAEKNRAMV